MTLNVPRRDVSTFNIEAIPPFDQAIKRLARRYRHVKQDLPVLIDV